MASAFAAAPNVEWPTGLPAQQGKQIPLATFALMKTSNIQQGRHKQEDKFYYHRIENCRMGQDKQPVRGQDEIIKAICRLDWADWLFLCPSPCLATTAPFDDCPQRKRKRVREGNRERENGTGINKEREQQLREDGQGEWQASEALKCSWWTHPLASGVCILLMTQCSPLSSHSHSAEDCQ